MHEQAALVIGILSIGDMGLGIGKLLISQGYRVATFAEDRRQVLACTHRHPLKTIFLINGGLDHDVDVDAKDKPCCHPSAKLIFIEHLVNKPEKGLDPTP